MAKRVFDIALSFTGIILSLPLSCIIAGAICLEDGWPVFFSQDRVGKGGRIFKNLKFRSMRKGADEDNGPQQAVEDDPRSTRIGRILRKSAMDELPQLWNILAGDMSFVGPRALRPVEVETGESVLRNIREFEGFAERSAVTPGLTGIAQLLAPRDIRRAEKFKYDIWYIKNRSFWFDIYLILLSFLVTFAGRWETGGRKLNLLETLDKRVVLH
ncbi:MAG: sugar transferase [Candidatus Omnitrophica bacterium]|nr:sugar transferase [Candidatus Omnitrophota bacterium]